MTNQNHIYELKYEDLLIYIRSIIEGKIVLQKEKDIIDLILLISLNDIDFFLSDKVCHMYFHSENYYVKRMSIMAVGHIARVYGKLVNKELYEQVVSIYQDKKSPFWDRASHALDDIQIFLKIPKPQKR